MTEDLNSFGSDTLPGYLGLEILAATRGRVDSGLTVQRHHLAPHGYLHAATIVAIADTSCGYGCLLSLPEGATGFTTIELKSNFLATLTKGRLLCTATQVHGGRTTQVWDAVVSSEEDGRRLALFRCTQAVLWPKLPRDEPGQATES